MEQTAVEWLVEQMNNIKGSSISMNGRVQFIEKELNNLLDQAKAMEKEQIILLVERIMEYTKESHSILGHDEREASEFVDIFYKETFKSE